MHSQVSSPRAHLDAAYRGKQNTLGDGSHTPVRCTSASLPPPVFIRLLLIY